MEKIGIIQPGRLGDIIICLPIAKYFSSQGFKVIWPVFGEYINDLVEVIDYVDFIPVSSNVYSCVRESRSALNYFKDIRIFDVAATFPESSCTEKYVQLGDGFGAITFDKFKYDVCGVPFDEKWNLKINRLHAQEEQVFSDLVKHEDYVVAGLEHSRGKINLHIDSKYPIVEINKNYNFFAWIKVIEKSKHIVLVDSAMANLVEQLNLTNKKVLVAKPGQPRPFFKNDWIIANS